MSKLIWIVLFLFVSCFETAPSYDSYIGTSLPDFKIYINDGKTIFNTQNIENGHPVLLFFFSPDCAKCRVEIKNIIQNMEQFRNSRIMLITPASEEKFVSFREEFNLGSYNNIIAGIDKDNFLAKYLNIQDIPYLAIYGSDKKLKHVIPRSSDMGEITDALNN